MVGGWLNGWVVEWLVGWKDGWLEGWMVGLLDGWMVVVVRSCPQPPLTEAPRLLQRAIEEKKGSCSGHCLFGRLVILLST